MLAMPLKRSYELCQTLLRLHSLPERESRSIMKSAHDLNALSKSLLTDFLPKLRLHSEHLEAASSVLLTADEDTLADIGAKESGRCLSALGELKKIVESMGARLEE